MSDSALLLIAERGAAGRKQHAVPGAVKRAAENRTAAYSDGLMSEPTLADAVCMGLYWGEGSKKEQRWEFTNTDVDALVTMAAWLNRHGCPADEMRLSVSVHPDTPSNIDETQEFWSTSLEINAANIKVYEITKASTGKSIRKSIHPFGTVKLIARRGAHYFEFMRGQAKALGMSSKW